MTIMTIYWGFVADTNPIDRDRKPCQRMHPIPSPRDSAFPIIDARVDDVAVCC